MLMADGCRLQKRVLLKSTQVVERQGYTYSPELWGNVLMPLGLANVCYYSVTIGYYRLLFDVF